MDHQPVPERACCPECGADPSHESVVRQQLSAVGYTHEDKRLECSECDNRWTCGIPIGETDDDTWVCDACGGDLMPHFMYADADMERVRVKPKCRDCYWVPDDPIILPAKKSNTRNGIVVRFFIGHHAVTGDVEAADRKVIE